MAIRVHELVFKTSNRQPVIINFPALNKIEKKKYKKIMKRMNIILELTIDNKFKRSSFNYSF